MFSFFACTIQCLRNNKNNNSKTANRSERLKFQEKKWFINLTVFSMMFPDKLVRFSFDGFFIDFSADFLYLTHFISGAELAFYFRLDSTFVRALNHSSVFCLCVAFLFISRCIRICFLITQSLNAYSTKETCI